MASKNVEAILVTGVSKGIGKAIAVQLAAEGMTVYGTYNRGETEAKQLKEDVGNVEIFQVDLSKRSSTLALIEKLRSVRLDAIINNAGIFKPESPDDYDSTIWDDTLEVNLTAPLLLSLKLKDTLKDGGTIVNIASTDGLTGSFNSIAYAAQSRSDEHH